MATLNLFGNGISTEAEMATALERARESRRGSQPAAFLSYRRDSLAREPVQQSYRRSSIAPREPLHGYRRDSITREPIQSYRRDSITREPIQSYRRDSITREPIQSYRRDSFSREHLINSTRDSINSEPAFRITPQATGRRGSDADDINWIAKYQKSDHHTDRLVSSKLEHDRATGRNFTPQPDVQSSVFNPAAVTTNENRSLPPKPVRYEGTNKLTVHLQPARNDSLRSERLTPTYSSTSLNLGRNYSPSLTALQSYSQTAHSPDFQTGYMSSMADHRNAFQRQSSVVGTSVPPNPVFQRRSSVDSSLYKASRPSDFLNRFERGFSPSPSLKFNENRTPLAVPSKYMTEPTYPQSYRPYFSRAPSLPPSLPNTLPSLNTGHVSSTFTSTGSRRSTADGIASDIARRRSSLANISDVLTPNYRRSVDFGAIKADNALAYARKSQRSPVITRELFNMTSPTRKQYTRGAAV